MGTKGAGSGASGGDDSEKPQILDPAALKAGVKLQAGVTVKIEVKGKSGRPLPPARPSKLHASGDDDAADGTGPGAHHGGEGGQSVDNSNTTSDGSGEGGSDDVHVLATEVHTIGDSLLINHPVRVWSIETNEQVGEGTTDDKGVLRINVPKEGNYRVEILDEPINLSTDSARAPSWANEVKSVLKALFVDKAGKPLINEVVEIASGKQTFKLTTDAQGKIATSAPLAPHTLKVKGASFTAHSLPAADHKDDANIYRFVVAGKAEAA